MNTILSNRPLSPGMYDTLMEIHEREILGQDLCDQDTKHIGGLFRRGLIDMKLCNYPSRKPYMGFFATNAGRQFLERSNSTQQIA